jgi:hypothetical protein
LQGYKGNWAALEIMKTLIKNKRTYQRRIGSADQNLIGEELEEDEGEDGENGKEGNGNEEGSDGEEWYDRNSDNELYARGDEEVDGDMEVNGDEVDDQEVDGDDEDGNRDHQRLTWDDKRKAGTMAMQDGAAPKAMAAKKTVPKATITKMMVPKAAATIPTTAATIPMAAATIPKATATIPKARPTAARSAATKFKFNPGIARAGTKRKAPGDSDEEVVATMGRKNPPQKVQKTRP